MPVVEIPRTPFIDQAKAYLEHAPNTLYPEDILERHERLREIAVRNGVELLGVGRTRFVFSAPDHPGRVLAVHKEHRFRLEARIDYYLQNIYQTAWSHNFPRSYASFGSPSHFSDKPSGNINQRIFGETYRRTVPSRLSFASFLETADTDQEIKYPFSEVISDCKRWKIPLPIDHVLQNFVAGDDGGEYYVDGIFNTALEESDTSLRNVLKLMRARGIDETTQLTTQNRLERAYVLYETRRQVMGLK